MYRIGSLLALCTVLVLSLLACDPASDGPGRPVRAAVTDASGLFLQPAGAGRAVLAGGELAKVAPGYVGSVEFTDDEGKPVTVSVTQAVAAGPDHVLIAYSSEAVSGAALVALATGDLVDVPLPAQIDRMRVTAEHAYYVSGSSLHRVTLADGKDLLMSANADVSGPSRLYVTPSGAVFSGHVTSVPDGRRYWICYPDATPPRDLSSDGNAILFFEGLAGLVVEHAGTLYQIRDMGMQLGATEITLDPDGPLYVSPGTETVIDSAGPYNAWTRLAENLYTDDAHIYCFAGTTITAYPQSPAVWSGAWMPDARVQGDELFIGYDDAGTFRVRKLDLAAAGAETAALDEAGVTSYEVVADALFYAKADGTWRKDLATGDVTKYADSPAEIEAVR